MELHRLFPDATSSEVHERLVEAGPDEVWAALVAMDFCASWSVRALFRLRGITTPSLRWADLERLGFVGLHADRPRELIYGLVARPWSPTGGIRRVDASQVPSFAEPGYAVIGWNYHLDPHREATVVTTETRIRCTDPGALRAFRRYWALVRPFSGFIRRRSLALLADSVDLRRG